MAALLSLAKPATLSPQPTLSDPSLAEQERAGPRRVQPEKGSKEARRREYAASERQGRSTGRHASPCPPSCSFSSSDEHPHPSSSAAAGRDGSSTPTLSSSSSVRTPSPANSLNHPTTPSSSSSFSAHIVEAALPTAPPTPTTAAASSSSQYFSTVSLMLEEPHAALPKALWKADADADVCDRDGCTVRFGMFTARKHHCRKCGLIFCSACTAETHPLLFPRTLASALTSPLQSRNTSPSSSYSTITSLMPIAAAANTTPSSSSSSSRPPSPPLSDCGSGVPTPTPATAANPATPTRQVAVVTSRVCLDCKKSLSSPASMRPTIASRRSSTRSTLRPSGAGGPSAKELHVQPLHSLAEALQQSGIGGRGGLDSPDVHRSRNRSLSPASTLFPSASANTSPRLSSALPSLGGAATNASTSSLPRLNLASLPSPSPFGSTRSPAVTPHEPWMDGPLGEFPLAYPRRDGPLFDPSVHQAVVRSRSQLRMKSRSREGSLVGDSVKEEEGEDGQRVGRWRKGSHSSAGTHQSPPSQSSISPESNSTGPASVPDEEPGAQYNWSTF